MATSSNFTAKWTYYDSSAGLSAKIAGIAHEAEQRSREPPKTAGETQNGVLAPLPAPSADRDQPLGTRPLEFRFILRLFRRGFTTYCNSKYEQRMSYSGSGCTTSFPSIAASSTVSKLLARPPISFCCEQYARIVSIGIDQPELSLKLRVAQIAG